MHQVPPPPHSFTGREDELNELLSAHDQNPVRLFGLDGMGGVGKTALARKLAERLSAQYPDAQINLDLKGLGTRPLSTVEAMSHVIRSFHPKVKLPDTESALSGLYQTVLRDKRALLLMENASGADQIEALATSQSAAMIITSRQQLSVGGMHNMHVATLTPEDAQSLLLKIAPRIGEAAEEIARLCGNLPFALRLAAGVLVTRPDLTPADYVQRMGDVRRRLQLIDASMSLSYELLQPEMKPLWLALSIFPDAFDIGAAASVLGLTAEDAKESMGALVSLNLVEWVPVSSRYRLHDLVRVFTDHHLPEPDRRKVERRFFNHYLEVFFNADRLYREGGEATRRGLDLYDSDRANVDAAQSWIVAHAEDDDTAAAVCAHYPLHGAHLLRMRVHPLERIKLYEVALAAARRIEDREVEGTHLYTIGLAYEELGEFRQSIKFGRRYLAITRELNDRRGEAAALSLLGQVNDSRGYYRRAIILFNKALDISRELGDRRSESTELLNLGQAYRSVGKAERANETYRQALDIARELGIRQNEGSALACLAGLHLHHGCREAFEYSEQALRIFREIGYKSGEAGVLDTLGQLHTNANDPLRGIELQEQALDLSRQLSDPVGENKALGNIGLSYATMKDFNRAIDYYQQQLAVARRINDHQSEGNGLINMAKAYIGLGDAASAVDLCTRSMAIFRMIGSSSDECGGYAVFAEAYTALGDNERAADYYMQRARFARGIGHRGCEAQSYFDMGKVFYEMCARAEGIVCAQCALVIQERTDPSEGVAIREQLAEWLEGS